MAFTRSFVLTASKALFTLKQADATEMLLIICEGTVQPAQQRPGRATSEQVSLSYLYKYV